MSFAELVEFLKQNWPTILGVTVMVTPVVVTIFAWLHRNRVEEARAVQGRLQARIAELERTAAPGSTQDASGALGQPPPGVSNLEGIEAIWPRTNDESQADLLQRLRGARKRITVFGLTRNFYASDDVSPLVIARAQEIPVVFFMMHPDCGSRRDRYRIEPIEAALEDPARYRREVEAPLLEMMERTPRTEVGSTVPGLAYYYFNFPCSFAIEEIDDHVRVMLYGHGKRGTEGPILLLRHDSRLAQYFSSQLRWLEALALRGSYPPWKDKGVRVSRLSATTMETGGVDSE